MGIMLKIAIRNKNARIRSVIMLLSLCFVPRSVGFNMMRFLLIRKIIISSANLMGMFESIYAVKRKRVSCRMH
jgi:hypothetical protein